MEPRTNPFGGVYAALDQTEYWSLTRGTLIVGALVIFVTGFLLGFLCASMWGRR